MAVNEPVKLFSEYDGVILGLLALIDDCAVFKLYKTLAADWPRNLFNDIFLVSNIPGYFLHVRVFIKFLCVFKFKTACCLMPGF